MPVMLPSAEQMALWAAEEVWDWRVRALFAIVCAVVALVALAVYLAWGRERDGAMRDAPRARCWLGRLAVAVVVVAVAEASFFKEPVSLVMLLATAAVIGAAGLNVQGDDLDSSPTRKDGK